MRAAKDAWEPNETPRLCPICLREVFSGSRNLAFSPGLCGPSIPHLRAESANSMFKHGEAAEAREDYDTALDLYQKALAKAPNDLSYKTALYRVRVSASAAHMSKGRKLIEGGDEQGALVEFLHAAEIDPGNEAAQQEIAKIRERHGEQT